MLIFITTGTQKFQFDRLLEAMDIFAEKHKEWTYMAQSGACTYQPKHITCKPFMDRIEFNDMIEKANVIVTHGGTGVIINAIKKEKKVIAVPRLAEYGEHVDDHQKQLIEAFEIKGYIKGCMKTEWLNTIIMDTVTSFIPNHFESNTEVFLQAIDRDIKMMIKDSKKKRKDKGTKICFAASSGGHLEQLMLLKPLLEEKDGFFVTEKTEYQTTPKDMRSYTLKQMNRKEIKFLLYIIINAFSSIKILFKEKPDIIITTGVLAIIPLCLLAKITGRKLIYIESFAKRSDGTLSGRFLYRWADIFYVQWESMKKIFPNAKYVGSIY